MRKLRCAIAFATVTPLKAGTNMNDEPRKAPAEMPDPNEHPHKEDLLDAAIEDSMDASDPPAAVTKGQPTAPPRRPKTGGLPGKERDPGKSERG
jgi:hypothetical protein